MRRIKMLALLPIIASLGFMQPAAAAAPAPGPLSLTLNPAGTFFKVIGNTSCTNQRSGNLGHNIEISVSSAPVGTEYVVIRDEQGNQVGIADEFNDFIVEFSATTIIPCGRITNDNAYRFSGRAYNTLNSQVGSVASNVAISVLD